MATSIGKSKKQPSQPPVEKVEERKYSREYTMGMSID